MTKDEITAWALANGWSMIDGFPSLTKPTKPHPAIVRLVLKATVALTVSPLVFSRAIRAAEDGSFIFDYSLENTGPEKEPYIWCFHPLKNISPHVVDPEIVRLEAHHRRSGSEAIGIILHPRLRGDFLVPGGIGVVSSFVPRLRRKVAIPREFVRHFTVQNLRRGVLCPFLITPNADGVVPFLVGGQAVGFAFFLGEPLAKFLRILPAHFHDGMLVIVV